MAKEREEKGVKGYEWGIDQNTRVMVTLNGCGWILVLEMSFIDSGQKRESSTTTKKTIGWYRVGDRPGFWDTPAPHKNDISYVRESAVRQATSQFTQDLMPTYKWVKVE